MENYYLLFSPENSCLKRFQPFMKYSGIFILCILCMGLPFYYYIYLNDYKFYTNLIYNKLLVKIPEKNVSEIEIEFNFDYDTLIKQLGLNKTKLFGLPYFASNNHNLHTFNALADHVYNHSAVHEDPIRTESVKCGEIIWVKTDYINDFLKNLHKKIKNPYVLITHDSDYSVGDQHQLNYLNDSKIIMWFAQNINSRYFLEDHSQWRSAYWARSGPSKDKK